MKPCDLEEWTLIQEQLATPLVKPIFEVIKKSIEMTGSNDTEIAKASFDIAQIIADLKDEPKLLALLYIEDDETRFKKNTYDRRIREIQDMTMKEIREMRQIYSDFFGFYLKNVMTDTNIYFAGMSKMNESQKTTENI